MSEAGEITEYAIATATWETWYEEYRFGAMYIFPPAALRQRVNGLRERFDPRSQAICDAHISLTVPLRRPMRRDDAVEVAAALRAVPSFEIMWGPVLQYPGIPGVVLRIEPTEPLAALVATLEGCGCFVGASPRRYPFSPHMTIAEFITLERSETLVQELSHLGLTGRFWCSEVAYAVPDAAFHFTERATWPLGAPA